MVRFDERFTQPTDPPEMSGYSIQSMIEKLYVGTGNQVLGNALTGLQQALQVSTAVLTTLNQLQIQKNSLVVSARVVQQPFPSDEEAYLEYASQVFGSSIKPVLSDAFDASAIATSVSQLEAQLTALSSILTPEQQTDPNGLFMLITKVKNDIETNGAEAWVMDNYDQDTSVDSNKQGNYQNSLTLAITAGQSLSDTQKEQVNNYLFIFEEYYKSAGAMLSKISSIIEMMAQNISRG